MTSLSRNCDDCGADTGYLDHRNLCPSCIRNRLGAHVKIEKCEWYPTCDARAVFDEQGCQAEATVSVGTGKQNLHLCDSCATLSRFNRYKKKPLKKEG